MAKCIFTGEETLNKTKNIPVSREGREVLKQRQEEMTQARYEEHKKFVDEVNEARLKRYNEDGTGDIPTPFPYETDLSKFRVSISEVLTEQLRQNTQE